MDCHTHVLSDTGGRSSHRDLGALGVPFSAGRHSECADAVERFRHSVLVEVVATEAVEMAGRIRAEASDQVRVQSVALCLQPFQGFAHGHDIVKDQQIPDEMVVFDELTLLVADSFGGQRAAAEGDPLEELIEAFALFGRCLDEASQFDIGEEVEQKPCTDRMAQLPKGEIEFALARVGCQPAEDGGGFDPTGPDRDRHPQHLRQHGSIRVQSIVFEKRPSMWS
ncbi:MAG: hypothetical protein JWQ42_4816 [Edaphobacter sp.]|nr:hypothetical protein [Edaphobacter sp.]